MAKILKNFSKDGRKFKFVNWMSLAAGHQNWDCDGYKFTQFCSNSKTTRADISNSYIRSLNIEDKYKSGD